MTTQPKLTLVSHKLCPYVQRAAIAFAEKGVPFERVDIDLANKPDWFKRSRRSARRRCCSSATPRSSSPP